MKKQSKTIGIIGGMGPYASAYFYKLLLKKSSDNYGAKNNDDFPEILIDSVPVPDFISDTKKLKEARKMLISRIKEMNSFGVGSIGMVCNTGHILHEKLSSVSKTDFYSMIDLVAVEASKRNYKKVGILATPTTIKFDLYGKSLSRMGIKVVYPDKKIQRLHELVIRDAVAGKREVRKVELLENITRKFIAKDKLDGIILGCTELPLVFPKEEFDGIVIDSMEVLADKFLEKYYN